MKADTALWRWCGTCLRFTRSWFDVEHEERCTGCDPESGEYPGYGVRDFPEDGDW